MSAFGGKATCRLYCEMSAFDPGRIITTHLLAPPNLAAQDNLSAADEASNNAFDVCFWPKADIGVRHLDSCTTLGSLSILVRTPDEVQLTNIFSIRREYFPVA
jgi:hypothetical protein